MEVVPWTYNNPRINASELSKRSFLFCGQLVHVFQDVDAEIDVHKNTELKLWDGAYFLARYLEHINRHETLLNKRCVELGAGCGLVGIVAWLLKANVTLTDLPSALSHTKRCVDENIARLTSVNAGANEQAPGDIGVKSYRWGDEPVELAPPYDVILGSDIIYDELSAQFLVEAFKLLSDSRTVIYVSYKRRGLGEDCFFTLISNDFACSKVSDGFQPADFLNSDYEIFKFMRKS